MKKLIITLIGCFALNISFGQEMEVKSGLFGYKFLQNGEKLNWKEAIAATESVAEANLLIKKAKTQITVSSVFLFAGGWLIGTPIGQSISDKDPNWTLAYVGAGLSIIGFTYSFSGHKKVTEGVEQYNQSLEATTSNEFKPQFNIIANNKGIGLSMSF